MRNLGSLILMIFEWFSPGLSHKVSKYYWRRASIKSSPAESTIGIYDEIKKLIIDIEGKKGLSRENRILDAACGDGELVALFKHEGFKVEGVDISEALIKMAREKFPDIEFKVDDLINMETISCCFTKIFVKNAIFYIHPKLLCKVLENLYSNLSKDGVLYILDWPDFDKRHLHPGIRNKSCLFKKLYLAFTQIFPVYQPKLGGFWYKGSWFLRCSKIIGFRKVVFTNSWSSYRSHVVLIK